MYKKEVGDLQTSLNIQKDIECLYDECLQLNQKKMSLLSAMKKETVSLVQLLTKNSIEDTSNSDIIESAKKTAIQDVEEHIAELSSIVLKCTHDIDAINKWLQDFKLKSEKNQSDRENSRKIQLLQQETDRHNQAIAQIKRMTDSLLAAEDKRFEALKNGINNSADSDFTKLAQQLNEKIESFCKAFCK